MNVIHRQEEHLRTCIRIRCCQDSVPVLRCITIAWPHVTLIPLDYLVPTLYLVDEENRITKRSVSDDVFEEILLVLVVNHSIIAVTNDVILNQTQDK